MKTIGLYYIPSADKLILITKCEYYEDLFNPAFSIVTWEQKDGVWPKCLITNDQFYRFVRIGSL